MTDQSGGSEARAADAAPDPDLRELVHDLDGILWELDPATGRYTFVSRGAERLLGYPGEQWLEEPDFRMGRLVHPDDREEVGAIGRRETAAGRDHAVEYRAVAADGRVLWLRDRVRVVERAGSRRLRGVSVDVTEQKRAEEALARQKDYYKDILDHIDIDLAVFDPEGRFEYINPSGIRDPDVRRWALGRTNLDYCRERGKPMEIGRRRHALIEAAVREGKTIEVEEELATADGGARVILRRHFPLRDEEGRVIRVIGQGFDITERQAAESELRFEREKQDALLNAIPDIVWMKDEDSRFLTANEALARAVGRPREEIIGKTDLDLFPKEMAERYRSDDLRVLETGRQITVNETVRQEDGSDMVVETIKVPFRDENGAVAGTAGIARDVTGRKRAEAALRESETRFRTLIESVSDAIAILDADGTVRYLSPAYERITGYTSDERTGRSAFERVHPEDADAAELAWQDLIAARDGMTAVELRLRRRDGAWRRVEIAGRNLLDDPIIEGVVVTFHDVTERRSLEEQLRGAQKMEAVGRLAGGIAHDFNNVLTAIKGHAQFMLEDAPDAGSLRADIDEIIQCTNRAHNLTRQLLAFSRQQPSEQRVMAPEHVVRGAETMLRRLIGEDVALEIALAEDLGRITADPTQMEQVLVNLAINARDAMPGGGRLTIALDAVRIRGTQVEGVPVPAVPGSYVRLTVSDTGTGMDPETQEHIFEPFFTTKAVGAGTGLGLSTVYGIVKQARGYIGTTSEPGAGTTFTVYLPRTEAEPEETAADPYGRDSRGGDAGGSETVLLVEDQRSVRALARRVLERAGYQVLEAEDGSQALDVWEAAEGAVDLLLTDVVMPNMGGKDLALRLRELRPDLKVLYMSGYAEEQIAHRGILEPGANLLEKPFDPRQLRARVRGMLDRVSGSG